MRIQVLSDLHFEHQRDAGQSFVESLDPAGVDVLVLAGDICTNSDGLLNALGMFATRYPHVAFVSGNHEYYGSDRSQVDATLRKATERHKNLHGLNRDIVTIGGKRFLGTTLWFPDSKLARIQASGWSDFIAIPSFAQWVYDENAKDLAFLRQELQEGDIVVSHYLPSWRSVDPKYAASSTNCFFVCDVEDLIDERKPALWIHGHTHESMDYTIGPTRVVCNPFGYVSIPGMLNGRFNEKAVVDLP